jgi:hypothetical protein
MLLIRMNRHSEAGRLIERASFSVMRALDGLSLAEEIAVVEEMLLIGAAVGLSGGGLEEAGG